MSKVKFQEKLAEIYTQLFATSEEYKSSAARTTPEALAGKMTNGPIDGTANKDGEGVKLACKHFKISHTHKTIRSFLGD